MVVPPVTAILELLPKLMTTAFVGMSARDGPSHGLDRIDGIDRACRDLIMTNIEYGILIQQYGRECMNEVVELILETVLSQREYIRIAGDEYPREVIRSRMLKINSSHVEYVFDCIDKNTTKVRNIKAYLLKSEYTDLRRYISP